MSAEHIPKVLLTPPNGEKDLPAPKHFATHAASGGPRKKRRKLKVKITVVPARQPREAVLARWEVSCQSWISANHRSTASTG